MIFTSLTPLVLGLLPFAHASGLYKLKLQKIPPVVNNPEFESAYLAQKYGALPSQDQMPLMGAGGSGRRVGRPSMHNGEQLFWTQDDSKGGHGVPLTSKLLHAH